MDEKDLVEKTMGDFKFTVNVPVALDGKFIEGVLVGAFEGGSNYWIAHRGVKITKDVEIARYASEVVALGGEIEITDGEEEDEEGNPVVYTLTRDKMVEGYTKYVAWCIEKGRNIQTPENTIDACEDDIILQFALFGDVIYG
jgi:hypothetical protein